MPFDSKYIPTGKAGTLACVGRTPQNELSIRLNERVLDAPRDEVELTRRIVENRLIHCNTRPTHSLLTNLGTHRSRPVTDHLVIRTYRSHTDHPDPMIRIRAYNGLHNVVKKLDGDRGICQRLLPVVVHCCVERINGLLAEARSSNGGKSPPDLQASLMRASDFELWIVRKYGFDQLDLDGGRQRSDFLETMRERGFTRKDINGQSGFPELLNHLRNCEDKARQDFFYAEKEAELMRNYGLEIGEFEGEHLIDHVEARLNDNQEIKLAWLRIPPYSDILRNHDDILEEGVPRMEDTGEDDRNVIDDEGLEDFSFRTEEVRDPDQKVPVRGRCSGPDPLEEKE
jgi:hypothetical protein